MFLKGIARLFRILFGEVTEINELVTYGGRR